MTDTLAPQTGVPPKEPTPEEQRSNVLLGFALFGVFVLLVAGVAAVAFVYLALD